MTWNSWSQLWRRIEPWFFSWVILLHSGLALAPPMTALANALNYVLVIPLVLNHWKQFRSVGTKDFSLLLLHALAILSFFWSAAPDATLDRLKALIRTTLLGIGLAVAYTPKQQTQLLLRTTLIAGILSLFAALAVPSVGISDFDSSGFNSWKGIFVFKNGLGLIMAVGGMLALSTAWDQKKHRGLRVVGFCGALILLFLSRSSTSLIGLILSLLVMPLYLMVKQTYKLRTALLMLALLLGTVVTVLLSNLETVETVLGWFGKEPTLTGRATLWEFIIQEGLKRPWLGYGYSAFWFTNESIEAISKNGWPDAPLRGEYLTTFHSHNGYIEFFTSLGFVGLGLFAFNFVATLLRVIYLFWTTKTVESLWMLQFLSLFLFVNYSEVGSILSPNQTPWILYVSVSVTSLIQKRQIQKQRGAKKISAQVAFT